VIRDHFLTTVCGLDLESRSGPQTLARDLPVTWWWEWVRRAPGPREWHFEIPSHCPMVYWDYAIAELTAKVLDDVIQVHKNRLLIPTVDRFLEADEGGE